MDVDAAVGEGGGGRLPLLCIDLGSMPMMGFVPDTTSFVDTLISALQACEMRGILLTGRLPYGCVNARSYNPSELTVQF